MTVIDLAFGRRSLHSHMEHKLNPMIFASQAISGAMRSVEEVYNPAGGFTIKGHSRGADNRCYTWCIRAECARCGA